MNDKPQSEPGRQAGAHENTPPRPSFLQVLTSTLAAAFGVQSSRNRQRDFTTGNPTHFIVAGILFTVLFVLGMVLLVRFVISAVS